MTPPGLPKEELKLDRSQLLRSEEPAADLFRMYNHNTGEQFYTENSCERDFLRGKGWNYEGVGWRVPLEGAPVYRMYNPNSGEHFYSLNSYERDMVVSKGWRYEGVGWKAAGSNGYPVYRLYNPHDRRPGAHHFTLNSYERDQLQSVGWRYEGVSWFGVGSAEESYDDIRQLNVPNYNQYAAGAPSGCEGASLLQALQYKGRLGGWSLRQFLDTMPHSSNGGPNNGFVGPPYTESPNVYSAIYPGPLASWGQAYGNVSNITGSSMDALINEVRAGNPVVTWVTINFQTARWGMWSFGAAVNNNHAVTLDGYNIPGGQVHVSDPISGSYWLSRSTFETIYNARKFAVVIR
ncbi:C39 family peptidase [Bifidobacterium xylocopae]|uniref:C39 family peptidase n=1 Tax=Bifidobacterium xylocopae TaxID=2493119 RepID=UPI00191BAB60|nr:C39 family peptidase [Bifidobacterium xylocopae]